MIPVLILFGLVTGRWWKVTIPLATLGWPVVLAVTGVTTDVGQLIGGAVAAAVNTAVGVLLFAGARRLWLAFRPRWRSP